MLLRAAGKIDARVYFPVIAAGSLQRQIRFFFHQQNIQFPFGKFPGNGGSGNSPADDEHIGMLPFQGLIGNMGPPHRLRFHLIAANFIDHMGGAVFFGRHGAGFHRFRPGRKMAGNDNTALGKFCFYRAGKAFFQPPVDRFNIHLPYPPRFVGRLADFS